MPGVLARLVRQPRPTAERARPADRRAAARELAAAVPTVTIYPESLWVVPGGVVAAGREGERRKVLVCGQAAGFIGLPATAGKVPVLVCDAEPANLAALRARVPCLNPVLPGPRASVGLGDRLGLATPGHIAAAKPSGFFLVLAQQSIREMQRTGRTARQVMDEAVFGAFQAGYDRGFGSDADHLKTMADVDLTAAAGFASFTIDPSEHVDDTVARASKEELAARLEKLIVAGVPGAASWWGKYVGRSFPAGRLKLAFDGTTLLRAAAKYGRAVAHVAAMARHIAGRVPEHEIELSVDETALPTSAAEHLFIVNELRERGIIIHSLAPRYVGEFEKGVNYKGSLRVFEESLREHSEIARQYGPYKLSIHSGSDKFRIYPVVARVTDGWFHLKTAGTSYLEALRVVARAEPEFFRELVGFCRRRYESDKRSYHVSAVLAHVPGPEKLSDAWLEKVYLDRNPGRQILHVTFGSVLTHGEPATPVFRARLLSLLNREAGLYVKVLKKHIGRHVEALRVK